MRVLFTTAPLPGHLYPMVPLAWALRAAGHQVLVAAPENFSETVVATGLPAATSAPPVAFEEFMLHDRDGRRLTPAADPAERRRESGRAWGRLAARTLDGTLRLIETWRPDLLVCEPMEYAGQLAASAHGVPWIEPGLSLSDFSAPEGPRASAVAELGPERAALGVPRLQDPALFLDVRPAALRGPDPRAGLPMRYVPYNGPDVRPPWLDAPRSRPRICLTLGSMLPTHGRLDFPGRMAELARALTGLGAEVVVAVDDRVAEAWRPLPSGVVAAGRFALERGLTGCDLLISHGGPGSVFAALSLGVPQLCLPQTSDQFDNSLRLQEYGCGLRLLPGEASTEAVLERAEALLREAGYRERASEVAAATAAMPAPADVVAELAKAAAGRAG
ncbi:UDP:flavonoid glycosyltransferase YjiC, YdhE family [Streptomyces misionensis]|uniref:UDP:flavonoid glycosyltransferase YjiC, YdhE family n=1 Tax=Streptomyces misionensis TaxID=67331 RepID=A0A1H4IAG0_9ACTN|nr:nucleotide disphospho-sugar-binding domain-containing protein [Streptomyces misionensis]SEB31047.1 UDP:flavonoid glycosyltransferase YjiC, YdhE family [Streptomyces misionensis]